MTTKKHFKVGFRSCLKRKSNLTVNNFLKQNQCSLAFETLPPGSNPPPSDLPPGPFLNTCLVPAWTPLACPLTSHFLTLGGKVRTSKPGGGLGTVSSSSRFIEGVGNSMRGRRSQSSSSPGSEWGWGLGSSRLHGNGSSPAPAPPSRKLPLCPSSPLKPFHASPQLPVIAGIPRLWQHWVHLCLLLHMALCLSICVSLLPRAPVTGFRAHPDLV